MTQLVLKKNGSDRGGLRMSPSSSVALRKEEQCLSRTATRDKTRTEEDKKETEEENHGDVRRETYSGPRTH